MQVSHCICHPIASIKCMLGMEFESVSADTDTELELDTENYVESEWEGLICK